MPLSVPKSFTCRSIGSRTQGELGSFYVCKHGAWVEELVNTFPFPWLRRRWQVVIALFVPCNLTFVWGAGV
jgi:hypothetical protein